LIISIPAILAGAAGLVMGIIARKSLTTTSGATDQSGAGMALAGIICGAVGAGLGVIGLIIHVIVLVSYAT
jgi:hypothetical protein